MRNDIQKTARMIKAVRPSGWIALACVASVLFLSVLPVETGHSVVEEYLCIVVPATAIIGLIISIKSRVRAESSLIDLIVAAWYLYCIARLWLDATFPTTGFALGATLMLMLYTSLRILISSVRISGNAIVIMLVGFALVEAGIGFYQMFTGSSRHYLYPVTGSFLNPGPYSAYLALGAVLLLPLKKNDAYILLIVIATALVATMSRAAFFAVAVCALAVYHDRIRGWRQWLGLACAAVAVTSLLYMFKQGSADGRGVIDYIGVRCFAGNPWLGSGIGSFFHKFAEETVSLSRNGINAGLMKVDVMDYAFNDPLRVGVEQGIAGLTFAAALIVAVMRSLWNNSRALFLGMLSLLVMSLFSYPFELLPFQIIMAVIVAFAGTEGKKKLGFRKAKNGYMSFISVGLLSATVVLGAVLLYGPTKTARKAEKEYALMAGTKDTALIKDFYKLLPYMEGDKRFLFDFGVLLAKQ